MCNQTKSSNSPYLHDLFCNHCGFNFLGKGDMGGDVYVSFYIKLGYGKTTVRCENCKQLVNDDVMKVIEKWFLDCVGNKKPGC